jgi:hypothetical protein
VTLWRALKTPEFAEAFDPQIAPNGKSIAIAVSRTN